MNSIIIHEVGMRDGLQMEKQTVDTETKIKWIDALVDAEVEMIQIGSFVHPVKMPQMADTDALFDYYSKKEYSTGKKPIFTGLVLNEKGLDRGLACGVDMFCLGVSASETHSMKNTGMSVDDAVRRIIETAKKAEEAGKRVQVSVQSAFGCGFEGIVPEEKVLNIVKQYLEAGLKMISLADTAGHAYPEKSARMFAAIKELEHEAELAAHFHNTYGLGIANCYAATNAGAKYIETAFGGLGGCPFTKTASGNVCTEDYLLGLQKNEMNTNIKINNLISLANEVSGYLDKDLPGCIYKIM